MGSLRSSGAFLQKATLNAISDFSKKIDQTDDNRPGPASPEIKGYGTIRTETPLHIAATCGHDEAVEVFLKHSDYIDETTDGGWTALHNAAWFGRVSIVTRLITAGADARAVTKEKLTPLHCAVKNSRPDVVERLLSKHKVDIEAEDQFGLTPFHMACKRNDIEIMERLLDYGCSIERKLPQGWTPLLWACISGHFAVVELLLKRGADVHAKWSQMYPQDGKTIELGPIGLAKAYQHEEIARLLERFGTTDRRRLADDEAKALPPADPIVEHYSVPQVLEVDVAQEEGMETGELVDADDGESSAESEGESDDGSEVSDGESWSRKQSASDIQPGIKGRRRSSNALVGFATRGNVHDETDVGAVPALKTHALRALDETEVTGLQAEDSHELKVRDESNVEAPQKHEAELLEASSNGAEDDVGPPSQDKFERGASSIAEAQDSPESKDGGAYGSRSQVSGRPPISPTQSRPALDVQGKGEAKVQVTEGLGFYVGDASVVVNAIQDSIGPDAQGDSHEAAGAGIQAPLEASDNKASTAGTLTEASGDQVDEPQDKGRSRGTPKSPGSFGGRFGRFVPVLARKDSAASGETKASAETTEDSPSLSVKGGDTIHASEPPNGESSKSEGRGFGRFGLNNVLARKNKSIDNATSVPDEPTAESVTVATRDDILVDGVDNPLVNQADKSEQKRPGLFSVNRVLSWKNASAEGPGSDIVDDSRP